ncbi:MULTISPECIES: hypothetical protein [Corynebacterium]|uniref:hypothetical protein n=1 Tax=Corynebacterium TaxID=1716 RepID=UPI001EEABD03|nr:hypothetical protein [Corynebacterium sp. BWA136]MDK2583684.1 hypothetical protein [Corynebacterium sp. BWA136]
MFDLFAKTRTDAADDLLTVSKRFTEVAVRYIRDLLALEGHDVPDSVRIWQLEIIIEQAVLTTGRNTDGHSQVVYLAMDDDDEIGCMVSVASDEKYDSYGHQIYLDEDKILAHIKSGDLAVSGLSLLQ